MWAYAGEVQLNNDLSLSLSLSAKAQPTTVKEMSNS